MMAGLSTLSWYNLIYLCSNVFYLLNSKRILRSTGKRLSNPSATHCTQLSTGNMTVYECLLTEADGMKWCNEKPCLSDVLYPIAHLGRCQYVHMSSVFLHFKSFFGIVSRLNRHKISLPMFRRTLMLSSSR
jgi:hypothetical protein